tara:strand:- start:6898 stop:7164 length:267 start_codon:yes stop_codon:yes gene_type:complete
MQLTIIKADNAVYIDGKMFEIDCSNLNPIFHAVQWDGTSGWKEFVQSANGPPLLNETIVSIDEFQPVIDVWNAVKQKEEQRKLSSSPL